MGDKDDEDLGSLVFVAPLRDPELGCRMCRCLEIFSNPPISTFLLLLPHFLTHLFVVCREERREGEQVTVF